MDPQWHWRDYEIYLRLQLSPNLHKPLQPVGQSGILVLVIIISSKSLCNINKNVQAFLRSLSLLKWPLTTLGKSWGKIHSVYLWPPTGSSSTGPGFYLSNIELLTSLCPLVRTTISMTVAQVWFLSIRLRKCLLI